MVSAQDNSCSSAGLRMLPTNFLTTIKAEPVGRWFLSHWDRLHTHRNISITGQESDSPSESSEDEEEVEFEDDLVYLRSLDPKECKDQDHYKVLGIAKLRQKATDEQIKKAYRFKVLRHHPDKRRAAGEEIREGDDYFTCITKASEVLGNPAKRRAYDSVDPTFDDDVPNEFKKGSEDNFFQTFGPVFDKNARWSTRGPVPKLGDSDTAREKVEKFYKFWYDFQSWREYSYLDEEDKDKGSDREERRWIEKNNKVQRAEKKKEEMKRLRKLVDNAYNSDPRIIKFREDEKNEKAAKKKAKQDAAKARRDEEERIKREEEEKARLEKEKLEAAEKLKSEAAKKEKDAAKKTLKAARKTLRTLCKDSGYYATKDNEDERVENMKELDMMCEVLSAEELEKLNSELPTGGREAFLAIVRSMNEKLEREKKEMMERSYKGTSTSSKAGGKGGAAEWSSDELALLIKAVNLFPAGTNQRWEVVSSFINQHTATPEISRSAKETLNKAKELQQGDFHLSTLKDDANKKAYENLEKQKKREIKVDSEASQRTESAAEAQGINVSPWTPEEQQLLEQSLKTFPASLGAERWEKIANCIPNRSKKDCMRRYKELAEIVRAKKAAQAAAAATASTTKKA